MDKDIFVDNNIAKNFCNPLDPEYKEFILWLFKEGFLVVSQKLIVEYLSSSGQSSSSTNIAVIIDLLTRENRLKKFSNSSLKSFRIPKRIEKKLRSNKKDHEYLKIVILSDRKFALSIDENFRFDVNHYPGVKARAESRPQDIPYK